MQDKVISEDWRDNLRMSKNSFYKLGDLLAPFILKNTTYIRLTISPETQVTATLHYLSDAGRMRKTTNCFGIGKSIVFLRMLLRWYFSILDQNSLNFL